MIWLVVYVLMFIPCSIGLWGFYLAVINFLDVEKTRATHWLPKYVGYMLVGIGLLLDFAYNVLYGSVMFLLPPREPTFSQRLGKMLVYGGWRSHLALWLATNLLDPYERDGRHINGQP